jgi:hypothetical protein
MVSGTILAEYTSAVPADRLWKASFCDGHNLIPKLLPGIISSIDILEGDGAGVGSVKKFNFTDGLFELTIPNYSLCIVNNYTYTYTYTYTCTCT